MQGLGFVKKALAQNWVLENPAADQASDLNRLHDDLEKLYFAEYEKQWRNLLNDIQDQAGTGHQRDDSDPGHSFFTRYPYPAPVEAVEENTSLATNRDGRCIRPTSRKSRGAGGGAYAIEPDAAQEVGVPVPLRAMERHFEDLNVLVRGTEKSPPPLDNVLMSRWQSCGTS